MPVGFCDIIDLPREEEGETTKIHSVGGIKMNREKSVKEGGKPLARDDASARVKYEGPQLPLQLQDLKKVIKGWTRSNNYDEKMKKISGEEIWDLERSGHLEWLGGQAAWKRQAEA